MLLLNLLLLWLITGAVILLAVFRSELWACWKEPVLSRPVVIIESDDWGAGPGNQAAALEYVSAVLERFRDRDGRHPVMTLAMVLASADGQYIRNHGEYRSARISRETERALFETIDAGSQAGVFSTQLHGMEHFWPPALMSAASNVGSIGQWLERAPAAPVEDLPAALQTRWVDASALPARRIDAASIHRAATEEAKRFVHLFGSNPVVAVPPTFIWNDEVEKAWASAGVEVVMTPGRRYRSRDGEGAPSDADTPVRNGQPGHGGTVYLVRDIYFEPALGHSAGRAVDEASARTRLGRPALFETHRFNFLGDTRDRSLDELEQLLRQVLQRHPDTAFMSSAELARIIRERNPRWIEQNLSRRVHIWLGRIVELPRLRKLAWLTGWILPAGFLWRLTA